MVWNLQRLAAEKAMSAVKHCSALWGANAILLFQEVLTWPKNITILGYEVFTDEHCMCAVLVPTSLTDLLSGEPMFFDRYFEF